ncbi:MAG: hypothetical protein IPP94_08490 [Ignavibacteria bacterium]|nr:hypothetical protein [Ignavibacteria bacterium]
MIRVPHESWYAPLTDALQRALPAGTLALSDAGTAQTDWELAEQVVEVALVSPLACARNQTDISILAGASVSATGGTGDTILLFNRGLHDFRTVACRSVDSPDALLAALVLREKYHMTPVLHQHAGSPAEALADVDAILLAGDQLAGIDPAAFPSIDIVDEWFDMTELPFVRAVVAGWDSNLNPAIAEAVRAAGNEADAAALVAVGEKMEHYYSTDAISPIPGHYRYSLDDDTRDAIDEFFRLLFFHGLHRDVPALRYWE